MLSATYRRQLRERALDQYGYIASRDALDLGVPPGELPKLAHRGGLTHIDYGLYRFDDIPSTSRDEYMEAVLRVGPEAFLVQDAVLALHDLALVNPRQIRIGTPRRIRARLPARIRIIRMAVAPSELTVHEGIPTTTVSRALVDSIGIVMRDRLLDATDEAVRRGLIPRSAAADVTARLGAPDGG